MYFDQRSIDKSKMADRDSDKRLRVFMLFKHAQAAIGEEKD